MGNDLTMKNTATNYATNFLECVQEEVILTQLMEQFEDVSSDTLIKIKSGIDYILKDRELTVDIIPKTIANLDIKWEFSYRTYLEYEVFVEKFQKLNPNLPNYNIISDNYTFDVINTNSKVDVKNCSYKIDTKKLNFSKLCTLNDLFFELNFLIAIKQFEQLITKSLTLDFIVNLNEINNNYFGIYLK